MAAVHSLFRYAALRHPEHAGLIHRVLAIPPKQFDKALVSFLNGQEVAALLASPDRTTWTGRRDHALLLLGVQAGLRASELIGLTCDDLNSSAQFYTYPGVGHAFAAFGRDTYDQAFERTREFLRGTLQAAATAPS